MAFFHQLRLLIWKNGLGVIRQPGWSLTLVLWPVIIFLILAITRHRFPPVMKDACYTGPKNLPSTGFFPFLQTLMCNTDSSCHNKSRLTTSGQTSRTGHSLKGPPIGQIVESASSFHTAWSQKTPWKKEAMLDLWENIMSSVQQHKPANQALSDAFDNTQTSQVALAAMLESMNAAKRLICTSALSAVNTSSPGALSFGVVTFCQSNDTLLEVSLLTVNKMLMGIMLEGPADAVLAAGQVLTMFNQLQNDTSLLDSLLAIPRLLSSESLDQALVDMQMLLINLQRAMHMVQNSYPDVAASLSMVNPLLAGGINVIQYIEKWPGRDVYIALGDVVTLQNNTLSDAVQLVLQRVTIPLDKAIGLTMDRPMVHAYICENSPAGSLWLSAACMTGTVDMLLNWISPDKVAEQILLVWSRDVAAHDVTFAKGLLHSLLGMMPAGPGGQGGSNNSTRAQRSVDVQPQNIYEELFLTVGHVVLDIAKSVPEVDMVLQSLLRAGLDSMQTATLAVDTVEEMMDNILNDASQLQETFLMLMTNQTQASAWIGHVMDSVIEIIMQGLTSQGPVTCESLLGPFEWLLAHETVDASFWRTMLCQNSSSLQQALQTGWMPLIHKVQQTYAAIVDQGDYNYNVTLPMILSEWQKLSYNSVQFGALLDRLTMELGEGYWMSWISWNITYDVAGTLMDRAMWAVVRFGESLESSPLWPQVKTYMHIANWIVNYKPDVTTEPANCSLDMDTLSLDCDTGLNWPQFVQATSQALMTLPNEPQILISCLQGTLNLLQHVYGGVLQQQAASLFQQEIPGGDALSAYLSNVVSNLDDFFQSMTRLNSSHLSNTEVLLPLVHNLLQSTGLSPLMPLLYANGPLNVSTLLAVAVKLGRQNQYVFAFNETDPTMPDLERMLMQLLSAEGNLTLPLSLSMGHALLTYSKSLSPEGVARLREALQPFTNQTSTGVAEAILTAVEQLKRAVDAPDGDPTPIILACLRQLQEFLASALRVRRIDQFYLPSGQLSTGQVTDLHLVAMDILNLVTPEGLQNLTVAGPDAAQRVVLGKILAILPLEAQAQAHGFIADLQTLVGQLSFCTSTGQDCVASVSEIFTLLQQIVEIVVEGKGDVSISLAPSNPFLTNQESLQMTVTLFSLLLSPGDVAFVKTLNQTLYFIKLVMAKPNVTVSDVQNALTQSNLTLVELNGIAALAGAANINDLMVNILGIIKARQCFEPQDSPVVTTQCVMGLVNGLTGFLMNVPYLRNETAILSLIPLLVNNTISDVTYTITDFSSDPHMATIQILNSALANIKMNLQLLNLSSPEIVNEIKVVGGLLKLAANTGPFNTLNSTLLENPQYAQVAYLEIAQWYLEKVENVTSTSSFHSLLDPLYRFTEMQVALQLEQANFTLFVSNQVEELMKNLRYPIDGTGLSEIGQTAIKILQHQMELIKFNLEVQSDLFQSMGQEPVLNTTVLYSVENQITLQLNLISFWLKHPNVTSIFSSMLQWGSNSSSPGTDIHQLLQTMSHFLNSEQLTYLSLIDRATQALNNVVMVAQQPGGLQSAQFSGAILEAVQIAMHGLTAVTGPLPLSLRETILSVIQDSLNVATHGNFSSDPQMATMQILNSALTSVTMSLQLMNLSSSEIRNEIKMVEGLLNLATNTGPLNALDSPLMENPQYAQVVYLEIAQWYLKKVENATSTSSLNSFLSPFYRFTEMQLAVQLAQANFSLLVSNRVEHLTKNLRYPIDGTGLSEIGQTVIEILQHQMKLNKFNIEVQSDYFQSIGQEPMLNTTMLYSVCDQITQQLNLIRDWMKHPNVTSVFSSMLLWGSNSTNSSPGTDIHQLLQTLPPFFSSEIIDNVTQALVKALAVAQQPGGLQSAQFSDAVSEAAQIAMHSLTTVTGPLPVSVQETILKAVRDSLHLMSNADFGSDPLAATMQILNSVLDNIKMNLQLMNLSSPEIMNEIRMVEGLLKLVANTGPINALNSTLLANPQYALEAFLEIAQWYLKELENATSTSSLNSILYPFYRFTEMQVDVTLLYSNFTVFVSSELEQLIMNLYSYPINGTGVSEIGQTVIEILQQQVELIKVNLEFQNDFFQSVGLGPLLNTTILYPIEDQITLQLNLIHDWVKHPDVTSIFSSMLQWGSSSTNTSSPGTDIHQLLQTMVPFFSGEQLTYVSLIDNATLALNNVIMVAQQPGGLQSAQFSGAILEVVQIALHSLTAVTGPLPLPLREAIQSVVQDLLSSISDGNINALANITISVHLMNLTTFEIMNEIKVVEGLLNLATNTGPLDALNSTLLENPQYAQVAYLEVAQWYLEKVEAVTSASSFNSLLDPLYRFTEMQVAVQLAQANFTLFVSNQVEELIMNLRYPIDGTGMSEIGQTVIEILQGQMELITFNLESQNDYFQSLGQEPLCNSTTMYAVEYEITQQINLIHVWMKHPNVTSVFSSMLQWGSSSTNTSSPGTDINQLLQTMSPFFSGEQLTYLSLIGNATQTLNNAVMVAQQPGGLQSAQFSGAILEVAQIAMHSLNAVTGALPLSLRENILSVLQGSLHLVLNPEMGYASSRNISLHILKNVEHIVQQTLPEVLADYLLPVIQIVTTYFQTIATASGQNQWNEIVLNEMMTIQGAVPSNMAQEYISLIINVTQFILEPSQGNMNLWTSFKTGNLSVIISQMGELLNIVLTFVTGEQGLTITIPSLGDFAELGPVLEQILTGEADQDTWEKLEKMLEAVLSNLKGTQLWDDIPPAISLVETVIGVEINQMMAETAFIWSLQRPVLNLMEEVVLTVNTSRFNLSEVTQRLEKAISGTMHAAQQANGTLQCSEVLRVWEPVGEAAGLSVAALAMWCDVSLQPVLEAYAASDAAYGNLSTTHDAGTPGTVTVDAAASSIVQALSALYRADQNEGLAVEGLIVAFCDKLEQLVGRPLSAEAQLDLLKQFQETQMKQSEALMNLLTADLLRVAPSLREYVEACDKALTHIIQNLQHIQNDSSAQNVLMEAGHILLTSLNVSADSIFLPLLCEAQWCFTQVYDLVKQVVHLVVRTQLFGDVPMIYQVMEQVVASNDTTVIVETMLWVVEWWSSTQATGMDLVTQALSRVCELLRAFLPILTELNLELPANAEMFEELIANVIDMVSQIGSTGGLLAPIEQFLQELKGDSGRQQQQQQQQQASAHAGSRRRRREAPPKPTREPMDDFIDLFFVDYASLFEALSVAPAVPEIVETAHVFFSNADLGVVMKGATKGLPWALNSSKDDTIDAALGVLSYLTLPDNVQTLSMDLLMEAVNLIPDGLPLAGLIKNVTGGFASESQENLMFMQQTLLTALELFSTSPTDQRFTEILGHLTKQVCALEQMDSVAGLWQAVDMEPGLMCNTVMPSLMFVAQGLLMNTSEVSESIFQIFIGNPLSYDVKTDWATVFSESFGLNASSLQALNINVTSSGVVTVGEILRNKTAFMLDVQRNMEFDPHALSMLLESPLPSSNLVILSWLVNLRHCDDSSLLNMSQAEQMVFQDFCSLSIHQWYTFSLLLARHLNTEKLIYRMVLSQDMQSLVGVMLQMASFLTDLLSKLEPAIGRLESYLSSLGDLNLVANKEFSRVARSADPSKPMSRTATFTTLSRALCSKGILAVFGISKLTIMSETDPSLPQQQQREELIKQFKIPHDASPFCMSLYLDMVNTTGGAIAWAFLKPMLMGHILFTPNTPLTRAIMEKSNSTLQEFANLRSYSEDWIESSSYISKSAKLLTDMLPMLQNSLGNSFVENFIQMQTNINVGSMKDTLSNFSNMTVMLEKNQEILKQITTLSNLMVNISSCIKFDRYRGFDTAEELNSVAQDLAKNRDLYGSVIFKLPKDEGSSKNDAGSSSNSSSSSTFSSTLPPRVRYTIRMHMDNLMRTDRVRTPYFVRDHHISAAMTLRYNRGFIYLQESIDRAIIETQAGQKVTEPAVQLQPFPYPCFIRDEYLEAISFVFPLMLMIAWVLFVADFVKKLVHERELRLHEYMKMMGVNPLSHFFAWFLECAAYLVFTIFILTLVLKYGRILPNSDGFLLFLYFCDYGLSIVAISFLVSSFFDKTYIAGLSGSLVYVLCFFPFIVMMALESKLSFAAKSALGLFSPTCFSYASQYISRYESQGEGIQWSNSYISPMAGDTASFGWLCWLMLIDSLLYFIMGGYIRMVFPGKYGLPAPWYFPFTSSFWADLCCSRGPSSAARGMLFTNIMQKNQAAFDDDKGKGKNTFSSHQEEEETSGLPVGVALHGLTKFYGDRPAIQNLNVSFYEGQVTSLLGHNGAGKTTTMSLLTGLFAPSSGSIEVYGRDMQANIEDVRKELGVCMQYDVHFDHMTAKEHLMLYGQIKAPYWSRRELDEQVCKILQETGMYAHRHKRVGTLSGGMKRKLSISIAFIGGSRLVVLDEPTTGVDPCSRRSIWDIVIQHKKERTIIMSTHHLDEAEVLSDRIAFLERGGLKVCGTPLHLKDKLGQGYNLTLTKKLQSPDSEAKFDSSELKEFIQAHVPEARLKEAQVGDLVYSLPPFTSSNASSYRSLLTALDANLDALQLGCYGISDTTLEEVFLQLTQEHPETEEDEDRLQSISESIPDYGSTESLPEDLVGDRFNDKTSLTGSSTVKGLALVWQQVSAMLVKRFHHSRRDWKGLISQIVLPVIFVVFAMGLGSIKSDLQHYPELELSPALYNIGPSYSFFSNQNPSSSRLVDSMMSYPGIDNACLDKPDSPLCNERKNAHAWKTSGNSSQPFSICRCNQKEQVCNINNYQPPNKKMVSSQSVYNLTGIDVENYLVSTANDFIRNRYGGFIFGKPLPPGLQMDLMDVPKNRTVSKVWYNPEGHHTMPAYLNSLNNFILRSNIPADKDPRKYAISVSSHPYYGRQDDEDAVVQGMIQILVALCVLTGYSIMTASFAIYEVQEHHSGSKRLQHISGVSEPLYWAVNFFYDMVLYMIPVALTVAVVAIFQVPAFTERHNLGAVTLLLVLFGFSTFPWMYLLSGVFKDAEMAFITYVCINLFISVNTIMTTSIVYFMGQLSFHNEPIKVIFEALSNAFLIFPQFSFGNGLMELARINMEVQLLSGYGIDAYRDPFSTETLGWMFLSSLIQGLVFFALRLLINKGLIRTVRHLILGRKVVPQATNVDDDEDVVAESERVASGAAHTDLLQVNQLTKIYQHLSKKVHAVKRLSVGIPAGECFGLLGVNGAGKTTTFKMLTGDVSPTDGTAQIKDWDGRMVDIMECRNQGINIGYCPQVDALDDLLTGEEHLYFYARVRGISKGEIDSVVNYLLKKLELDYHRTTITDAYSCGTRRKLSTALALIGHPQILLLDEPSSGMDPRTKRHLWKIISEEVKGKCAVVLTSHSMEECEALCSRLAIMVKGQFRCLGSLQHIKNRFGSGFTVKMYLARASCDVEAITGFMRQRFPSTYLKDQHSAMVEYHVPVAPGGVADIFDQLESNKTTLQIKHFSISQTTLDEVFINFAMGKVGMETVPLNSEDSESLFSIESSDT